VDQRRGNSFSCGGSAQSSYEINEDSRKDHHNQLERKRRASIKSSYCELREAIPTLRDNKASRSVILQKAVEYLEELQRRNLDHVACVDHFSSENSSLETKCREIENQVQMLLRQQRGGNGYANGNYQSYNSTLSRPSYRIMDEDSNDLSGSTNSTPTASTSRSVISSTSTSTNRNGTNGLSSSAESHQSKFDNADADNISNQLKDDESSCKTTNTTGKQSVFNNRNETGSNSSSVEYFDDIEEIVAAKKPKNS